MNTKKSRGVWWKILLALIVAGLAAAAMAMTPSVESGLQKAKTGTVQDVTTKRPIAGAYVVVRWYYYHVHRFYVGHSGGGGTRCLYRAVAQTDAEGRYSIPSPVGQFEVDRAPSIEYDSRYFWELNVYAPEYHAPEYLMGEYKNAHPSVRWNSFGHTQSLEPIAMVKAQGAAGDLAYYLTQLPLQSTCEYATREPISFTSELYREAYPLTCERGGLKAAKALAQLRMDAFPAMPEMLGYIKEPMQQIIKRYHWAAPLSDDDARHICALLKQSNEASP